MALKIRILMLIIDMLIQKEISCDSKGPCYSKTTQTPRDLATLDVGMQQ